MGEVKRVLAWRHKSAEPIEAERAGLPTRERFGVQARQGEGN